MGQLVPLKFVLRKKNLSVFNGCCTDWELWFCEIILILMLKLILDKFFLPFTKSILNNNNYCMELLQSSNTL
jgi:hypothetical protein